METQSTAGGRLRYLTTLTKLEGRDKQVFAERDRMLEEAREWNLMHMARMIKDAGGIPAHGNQRTKWDAGCRSDFPNPDYR